MVGLTLKHTVRWCAPAPLWARQTTAGINGADDPAAARPTVLRFANDNFMDELLALVDDAPERIAELRVQAETWRKPGVGGNPTDRVPVESPISRILNRTKIEADGLKVKRPVALIRNPAKVEAPPQQAPVMAAGTTLPVKLYQPAHQRHYLVSASLIARESGWPDQPVQRNDAERADFVLRRLVPPPGINPDNAPIPDASWDEYAFLDRGREKVWQRVAGFDAPGTHQLIPEEERNPMFPLSYPGDCGSRQLHAGVIPVGKREQYLAASAEGGHARAQDTGSDQASDDDGVIPFEARSLARRVFQIDVAEPWKALVNQAQFQFDALGRSTDNFDDLGGRTENTARDQRRTLRTVRDQIQTASWYVLLDLARYLQEFLPGLWGTLTGAAPVTSLNADEIELFNILNGTAVPAGAAADLVAPPPEAPFSGPQFTSSDVVTTLADALTAIGAFETNLESVESAFTRFDESGLPMAIDPKWPSFLFPLADPVHGGPVPQVLAANDLRQTVAFERDKEQIDALADRIERLAASDSTEAGTAVALPKIQLDHKHAWFVVRCVYERPCCGPLFAPLVSAATQVFEMAPFFDPDAPARPVRIPMPVDITPAGLRKHNKNTAFVLSDMLCGRVKRMKNYTFGDLVLSVLPWPFHKDLPDPGETGPCQEPGGLDFGMICSLSIPIVTLCAFILLIIMVTLFDLFFRWIPYLMLCLPIPGLKSKPGTG